MSGADIAIGWVDDKGIGYLRVLILFLNYQNININNLGLLCYWQRISCC
jgi:hypothetical protein